MSAHTMSVDTMSATEKYPKHSMYAIEENVQQLHHLIDTNESFSRDSEKLKQQFKLAIKVLAERSEDTYLAAIELAHGRPIPYWM